MYLDSIKRRTNRKMGKKRVGRGGGSGKGAHTVGRGQKGQLSRTGHKSMQLFEGGNRPFYKRMPKLRGFKKRTDSKIEPINVSVLEERFSKGDTVSVDTLREKGLIRKSTKNVKILGFGEISKAVKVDGLLLSQSAREKIVNAKGSIKE